MNNGSYRGDRHVCVLVYLLEKKKIDDRGGKRST